MSTNAKVTVMAGRVQAKPAQTSASAGTYAADEPLTPAQRKMRLAHMASYIHEHFNHALDHVQNASKSDNVTEIKYDLNHAGKHLSEGVAKSGKLVEQTHQGQTYATNRAQVMQTMRSKSGTA
jgi:hypothetical protein